MVMTHSIILMQSKFIVQQIKKEYGFDLDIYLHFLAIFLLDGGLQ